MKTVCFSLQLIIQVVCFVGAFVGVAIGNWRSNNFFYHDMRQLTFVVYVLSTKLPTPVVQQLAYLWSSYVVGSIPLKLFAFLGLGKA